MASTSSCQAVPALQAARPQHCAARFGGHTMAETVPLGASAVVRLKRTFHSYAS